MIDARVPHAAELMSGFVGRTGVTGDGPSRRYLWTDAFAVCNLLGLERATGDGRWRELALRLVDRVHHVLGRHRPDDARTGWISGLPEPEGERHPTAGGLRIGKRLPERGPGEPFDERSEWDRDGQYFHYLTKWMHALDQTTRATGQALFHRWARELARAAHRGFVVTGSGGRKRMVWKASIDLSRPLVVSTGQHDPLDGWVTCLQLGSTLPDAEPPLADVTADFAAMMHPSGLATSDPLGLGGLLVDASRLHQLLGQGAPPSGAELRDALLGAALTGLGAYLAQPDLRQPATRRLAFRELGLAIGLAAVAPLAREASGFGGRTRAALDGLAKALPLREAIESFWLEPAHRATELWREHADINDVMLATSLAPEGFVVLPRPERAA
ncbi:MAG: hypothetical protein AB1689_17545 [Thermodesulfobacteriota bacterium]